MQGYLENLVKHMKVHSRCILKHANLPARFWSETTTMYMAVRNIMPTDKMKVPFTLALSHRLHFDLIVLLIPMTVTSLQTRGAHARACVYPGIGSSSMLHAY
jgi:hypothetical protein